MRHRVLGMLLLAGLLSGCSVFTAPAPTLTLERQQAINAWARAKTLYSRAVMIADGACRAGRWTVEECEQAAALHQQAKKLGAEMEAKLATPEAEIQWDRVMKLLELALDILL